MVRSELAPLKILQSLDRETGGLAKKVFAHCLLGYRADAVARMLSVKLKVVEEVIRELIERGLLRFMTLKTLRASSARTVYFPSPFGLEVCNKVELIDGLGVLPWALLQYKYLEARARRRERRLPSHEEMVEVVKEKLVHAGYEVEEGSGPDLIAVRGGEARNELRVEVETLSNTLDDLQKKVRGYAQRGEMPLFVVFDELAEKMMEQRLAYCAWEAKMEHFSFMTSTLDELPNRSYCMLVRGEVRAEVEE